MVQDLLLGEDAYRGDRFTNHPTPLLGNHDLLSITRSEDMAAIHRAYLEAGADFITTNTFNAQEISQSDYGTDAFVREINVAAAEIARGLADEFTQADVAKPRFVLGSLGPTNQTASLSPDVEKSCLSCGHLR